MERRAKNNHDLLNAQSGTLSPAIIPAEEIPALNEASSYPVSSAQLVIWLESQSEPFSLLHHIPLKIVFKGRQDIPSLMKAIRYSLDRHEILRTVFRLDGHQELRQYILPAAASIVDIECKDFTREPDPIEQAGNYIKEDNHRLFDLEEGPLVRTALLKCADDHYILYCSFHQLICDAESVAILKKEILTSYEAFKKGQSPSLPSLQIQYKDYTIWHLQQLHANAFREQQQYWLQQLGDDLPVLNFPAKQTRPPVKTYNGATLKTYISLAVTAQVKAYAHRNNGSLLTVIAATLHAILSRYTNTGDIIIGCPLSIRKQAGLEDQVGVYTNTVAIRNQLQPGDSFDSFFQQLRKVVADAQANGQYPFEQLLKDLPVKDDPSRNPVFDVMLAVNSRQTEDDDPGVTDENIVAGEENKSSRFNLLVAVDEAGDRLLLNIEYNTDLFETTLIRQFIQHYKILMTALLADPAKPISAISYLSEDEKVLTGEADTRYSHDGVIRYFEQQVQKTPDRIALQFGDYIFTYRELNERANQLAHHLRDACKLTSQSRIAVMLDRSHLNVIAMIGVMKSGACYVPVDQHNTVQHIQHILNDAAIEVVLTATRLVEPGTTTALHTICLDTFDYPAWSNSNPLPMNTLDDASFLVYISDPTDDPKGVMQTHRMLNNLVQWNIYHSGIDTGLKHLQYCSFSTEISIQDCWFVLSSGGTLFITPEIMQTDFMALADYIVENGIGVLSFPFAAMTVFFNELMSTFHTRHQVRHIISSGEQLTVNKMLDNFLQQNPDVKLHNHYGPSETHVVTSYTMSKGGDGIIAYAPIGKPVPNTFIHLLDKNLQPVPKKVVGEIYIGGEHLAAGYLNLPLLTAERFINSPFDKEQILYKTGDLAFADYNGNIIYLDHLTEQKSASPDKWAKAIRPLPARPGAGQAPVGYIAPRTEVEKRLIDIWKNVLGLKRISVTDKFFELGGHSLHITKMLYEINKVFGTRLQVKTILAAQNAQELAQSIEDEMSFSSGADTNLDELLF